jgi:uncharacterized protein
MAFQRPLVGDLARALRSPVVPLIHVVVGPRQVGKTTAVRQVLEQLAWPAHSVSADSPVPHGPAWLEAQWNDARRKSAGSAQTLLVIDEVQKVVGWSEAVKRLWDEDRATGASKIVPILLGSSALLVQKGLTESLAGRFMLHRALHWSLPECQSAFGWSLDEWIYFGGYPGAAPFSQDEDTWRSYVLDSLIETVVARDVLQMQTVAKPALLRQLFGLCAQFAAETLSYNKMIGQLHDAGNTTTLAHYLRLLETAFLISGLQQFSRDTLRTRASSPKLVLWNNALVTAQRSMSFAETRADHGQWGRLVENAVGGHLANHLQQQPWELRTWRDGKSEVDFVVARHADVWGLEVKSGRSQRAGGIEAFKARYPHAKILIVGTGGIALEAFFAKHPKAYLT